jgi:hypothetical protein
VAGRTRDESIFRRFLGGHLGVGACLFSRSTDRMTHGHREVGRGALWLSECCRFSSVNDRSESDRPANSAE